MADETVTSVVLRLIDVLEASGETYAFGGAIALAAWSEPRATADVDVILLTGCPNPRPRTRPVPRTDPTPDPVPGRRKTAG
jgi:hypothetical protein